MDITAGIINASTAMSAYQTSTSHGMIMAKKAKEQMELQGENLVKMMDSMEVAPVDAGQSLDVRI